MRRLALLIVALTVAACGTSQQQAPKANTFRPYACPNPGISTSPGIICH